MYINLEGIDGSGKSSVLRGVHKEFLDATITKEPRGFFREIILDPENRFHLNEMARMLLYQTDRALHVSQVVKPVLDMKGMVVSDRGILSTLCYQSIMTGLNIRDLYKVSSVASMGYLPDVIIYLKVSYENSRKRMSSDNRNAKLDHFDRMGEEFFRKLIDQYSFASQWLREQTVINVIEIDTDNRSLDEVIVEVVKSIKKLVRDSKCN